mmetsp:Transcript_19198/g.31967  ORF Transcript_19198/g.31967 Transcript_19198/m.31967 type:complete len:470 (+) Transcript_19198:327-1736(+)
MKFKTISRSEREHTRDRRDDIVRVQRNADPELHPFERAREYTRALNSAKLNKVFAKPLVGQLDGHTDGIWCMAKSPRSLVAFVSGACDGEIRVWDLAYKKSLWGTPAHRGYVRGVSVCHDGQTFYSCGDDSVIKQWQISPDALLGGNKRSDESDEEEEEEEGERTAIKDDIVVPIATYNCGAPLQGIDCHWSDFRFASCGDKVDIWDNTRMEPIQSFSWGADSVKTVKFNPAESNLVGTTGSDRSVCLYDIRQSTPLRKVILSMKSNAFAWNPMEPLNFIVANEDHNLYSFDMRNLKRSTNVHKDHVAAVMDVSFSPTGRDFCSASYDRTVRLFKSNNGRSEQVYHAKRMQRVFCAEYTADAGFVLSGSDDTNIRIWKADASKPLGRMLPRERQLLNYNNKLIQRYKHVKEVKRIHNHQHTPKLIKKERAKKILMQNARQVKTARRLKHDPNAEKPLPERSRSIVKELE